MSLWTGYSTKLRNDGMGADVLFGACTNLSFPLGIAIQQEVTSGSAFAGQTNINSIDPKMTGTYRDLKKIFDSLGTAGLAIKGTSNPGVTVYQANLGDDGRIKSGAVHRSLTWHRGFLRPTRVNCNVKDDAGVDIEGVVLYDGTNLPVIPADSVTLPAVPEDLGRWGLGGAVVGGLTLGCLQSADIQFGITVNTYTCESNVYPQHLSVEEIKPTMSFSVLNADLFKATGGVPLTGLGAEHDDTVVWFRKRTQDGIYVPDTEEEAIAFTAAGLLTIDDAFSFTQNKPGMTTFTLTCKFDGTNHPITVDTTYQVDES